MKTTNTDPKLPKTKPKLSTWALILSVAFGSVANPASAGGLDKLMEGMYVNTTSSSSNFDNQKMGYMSGGSMSVRVPIKSISIASFDTPRIDAGCGGIDLFKGSFSFINTDEIVSLLRSIAQNAVGLLFQLAIQAVSQPISTLLNHFSDKIQQMNQMLRNTCEAANKLVSLITDGSAQSQQSNSMMGQLNTIWGGTGDAFKKAREDFSEGLSKKWKNVFSKTGDNKSGGTGKTVEETELRKNKNYGNMAWKAMVNGKAHNTLFGSNSSRTDKETIDILNLTMNTFGSTIYSNEGKGEQPCKDGKCDETDSYKITASITAKDLMNPDNAPNLRFCSDDSIGLENPLSCLKVKDGKLADIYEGTDRKINRLLFGIDDSKMLTDAQIEEAMLNGRGLVGKGLNHKSTTPPTTLEKDLLESTSVPLLGHLYKLQNSPHHQKKATRKIYKHLSRLYATKFAESLAQVGSTMYTGQELYAVEPPEHTQAIQNFVKSIDEIRVDDKVMKELDEELYAIRDAAGKDAEFKVVAADAAYLKK